MPILDVFAGLFGTVMDLEEKIHNRHEKRKRAHQAKEYFVDALDAEIESYQKLLDWLVQLCREKWIPALLQVGEEPSPFQVIRFLDSFSDWPRFCIESTKCFIDLARACNEVSSEEGFMESLREGNIFQYDFVRMMGGTYVAENTVRIDRRFFRFFSTYKKDILKKYKEAFGSFKPSKEDKEQIALLEKHAKILIRNINVNFVKRHVRNQTIRKWQRSVVKLNKVGQALSVDKPRNFNMDIFVPPQIRAFTTFPDELGL
jgi:hypothetical protein